jgi:osmoprotectant transport system substrate-binding protein
VVQRKGKKKKREIAPAAILLLVTIAVFAAACNSGSKAGSEKKIVIGAKIFVENQIVAKIIQYDLGFKTSYIKDLNRDLLQAALLSGEIDVYPEYTNTGIIKILKHDPIFDAVKAYRFVKEQYKQLYNITWLEPSKVNDAYCFVLSRKTSDRLGITSISGLQAHAADIRAAQA